MKRQRRNDQELIEEIRVGGARRMSALEEIFKDQSQRQFMLRYLTSKGCSSVDAEDLIQDAMIIFHRKVLDNVDLNIDSIDGYIFNVVKLKWLNRYRSNKKIVNSEVEADLKADPTIVAHMTRQNNGQLLKEVLNNFGERCREMLLMFSQGYDLAEIATSLNMVDAERVSKEKYRCLNRIRKTVLKNRNLGQYIKGLLMPDTNG